MRYQASNSIYNRVATWDVSCSLLVSGSALVFILLWKFYSVSIAGSFITIAPRRAAFARDQTSTLRDSVQKSHPSSVNTWTKIPLAFVIVKKSKIQRTDKLESTGKRVGAVRKIRLHRFESLASGFRSLLREYYTREDYYSRERRSPRVRRGRWRLRFRDTCIYSTRNRAIPHGGKSATRNGWANFLFRSASGATHTLKEYPYIMHVYTSGIHIQIHTCTARAMSLHVSESCYVARFSSVSAQKWIGPHDRCTSVPFIRTG